MLSLKAWGLAQGRAHLPCLPPGCGFPTTLDSLPSPSPPRHSSCPAPGAGRVETGTPWQQQLREGHRAWTGDHHLIHILRPSGAETAVPLQVTCLLWVEAAGPGDGRCLDQLCPPGWVLCRRLSLAVDKRDIWQPLVPSAGFSSSGALAPRSPGGSALAHQSPSLEPGLCSPFRPAQDSLQGKPQNAKCVS